MKKYGAILALVLLLALLCACAGVGISQQAAEVHIIGVPIYNSADDEVRMFRDYLENYISASFEDVRFLYSESITTEEQLLSFIDACAGEGAEGIMAFVSYDLAAEVECCAGQGMYYLRAAGTSDDEQFEQVAANPLFLGEIGPGAELEAQAGAEVAGALAETGRYRSYLLLSGGAALGNEMHRLRTVAMLEELERSAGTPFSVDPEVLAATDRTVTVSAGNVSVTVCPGYISRDPYRQNAVEVISGGDFDAALAVLPVAELSDAFRTAKLPYGAVDCFSEENSLAFQRGELICVAGKYRSEVGPCFAAMYNAVTGNADAFRDGGRAFRLEQGFWTARSESEYSEMYGLSSGLALNAYSYEDLCTVLRVRNSSADLNTLEALVNASSYEECLARRQG